VVDGRGTFERHAERVADVFSRLTGTSRLASATVVTASRFGPSAGVRRRARLRGHDHARHGSRRGAAQRPFFDVARYPIIRFTSDQIVGSNADTFTIHGQLSMRDQTHPIVFTTHRVQLGSTATAKRRIRYEATAASTFRLRDGGDPGVIGNEVALRVEIEAVDLR